MELNKSFEDKKLQYTNKWDVGSISIMDHIN
jgi:hypothetical protein